MSRSLLFHHPSEPDDYLLTYSLNGHQQTSLEQEVPDLEFNILPLLVPLEREIAEPHVVVLKERERIATAIKAIAMRLVEIT